MERNFEKGIKDARILYSIFINDRFGLKRAIYKLIDKLTKNKFGSLSSYSTHILNPDISYLNLEHKEWNYPTKKDRTSKESFDDLFQKCIKNATFLIQQVYNVLYNQEDIECLYDIIEDLSYSNGLPIKDYTPMRYFEF